MNTQTLNHGRGASQPFTCKRCDADFSPQEHLAVQRQIEIRAHEFWRRHRPGDALSHWLRAEAEVIADFMAGRLATGEQSMTGNGGRSVTPVWINLQPEPVAINKFGGGKNRKISNPGGAQ